MNKVKKKVSLLLVLIMLLTILTACGNTPTPSDNAENVTDGVVDVATDNDSGKHTVVDIAGRTVTVPNNVTRVAALAGPSYETAILLGVTDKIIMAGNKKSTTGWANVVAPEFADLMIVDNPQTPNVEELASKGVQVAFFWDDIPDSIKQMEDAGIAVIVTQVGNMGFNSYQEFIEFKKKEITSIAEVFGGKALQKAEKWCAYVDEVASKITSKTATLTSEQIPSVYYVRGPESVVIHGGQSYTRFLVDMAGGSLVSKDDQELMYTTTMEQAVQWDPSYVIMGRVDNTELITQDPSWSSVQAVKDGNIYVNLDGVMFVDYSSECFLLMQQIAKILHSDLFSDLDLVDEVKSYYSQFYNYQLTDKQANLILNHKKPQ